MRQDLRIILEGPDGAGKTHLRDHLLYEFHNLEVVRNEKADAQDFTVWWPEQLERLKSPIVPLHDRFFYSELVYGPVLRGNIAAPGRLVDLVLWFLRSTAMVIYCRPPLDVIQREVHKEEQMKGVHDHLEEIVDRYDRLMKMEATWYGPRLIHYDWTREGDIKAVEGGVEKYLGESP